MDGAGPLFLLVSAFAGLLLCHFSSQQLNPFLSLNVTLGPKAPWRAKCAIVMSDNRGLDTDLSAAKYPTLAAVLNADYAERHNCTFRYLFLFSIKRIKRLSLRKRAGTHWNQRRGRRATIHFLNHFARARGVNFQLCG